MINFLCLSFDKLLQQLFFVSFGQERWEAKRIENKKGRANRIQNFFADFTWKCETLSRLSIPATKSDSHCYNLLFEILGNGTVTKLHMYIQVANGTGAKKNLTCTIVHTSKLSNVHLGEPLTRVTINTRLRGPTPTGSLCIYDNNKFPSQITTTNL